MKKTIILLMFLVIPLVSSFSQPPAPPDPPDPDPVVENTFPTTGNVGIGTTSPDERLTVKGKIHTQEVKVDLNGAVVPDYVFAKDYVLRSLKEIELYVNRYNHLPDIPSAKEIEKEGLYLKQMNLRLLQKIEELTLYMIQQEKEISEQQKQLQQQKEANKAMEARLQKIEQLLNSN